MNALWHGFADMGAVTRDGAFVVARGDGAYVYDEAGKQYLDATAGLWFTNVGHGRSEIADAVADQLRTIAHYSNFGDITEPATAALAEKLATIAPVPGSKIFFTSGGSDSVETAAKLARRYWAEQGKTDKKILIGRRLAYHGMHYASTAIGGLAPNKEGYDGPLVDETRQVEWNDAKSLLATIEEVGAEKIAAFFCEPIIGAGGVYPPPPGYLAEVRQICRDNDILFVADEVVTGFGRIGGSWFASTRFDLRPDLMTTAKGLTSGYLPMGAVFIAPHIAEPFFAGGTWFRHGYTYGGHAGSAAAALANLAIIERENLLDEALRLEQTIHTAFAPLADHPRVAEVRSGVGAVAAVQLADPSEGPGLVKTLREHGVSGRAAGAGAMQISPSFVMTDEQVGELAARFTRALG
ncbi:aminotransferase family protein [Nocardia camponoti]|uniref:Aspartate aminotransferase family protein n=1 Tax=Nocardia camponoti TaxID=1616106 RepID=A0A917V5P5_9NOCA|nr:aminotransferase class III-fold pyridoxal phosphate-dependent enzyme [Nocardia camponoti]GGK41511.1 aspartate aminotransferase family protein [Nocardia camponoti]